MLKRSQRSDFVKSTRAAIIQLQAQGFPAIHEAAMVLEISPRTLQRRLSEAGTSYSQVAGDLRYAAACRLLRREGQSVADIARALDYSDPAHFTHAFIRWTGVTPSTYRHQCKVRCKVKRRPRSG